jgi:hypothetical protein
MSIVCLKKMNLFKNPFAYSEKALIRTCCLSFMGFDCIRVDLLRFTV